VGNDNEWRWRDGMTARLVKNQLITKPLTSVELAVVDSSLMQSAEGTVSQHGKSLPDRTSLPPTRLSCDGSGIAQVFGKLVDMY
jgi:hypothetical protein